jgi:mono/diheme cytochrome c family protein
MFRKTVLWIGLTAVWAAAAFAAGQELPEGDGKQVLEVICSSCHNLDRITSKNYDKDAWEGIVTSMKDKGAELTDEDIAVLVDYLAKNFGKAE